VDNQTGPLLFGYIVCVIIAWLVGGSKGQGVGGFIFGLFFGPLGILFAMLLKPTVPIQAKRDVALEAAREAERERLREEGRAQARAEMQQPPAAE
jgi:hypothetical protein